MRELVGWVPAMRMGSFLKAIGKEVGAALNMIIAGIATVTEIATASATTIATTMTAAIMTIIATTIIATTITITKSS